jgi:hypothetical protein
MATSQWRQATICSGCDLDLDGSDMTGLALTQWEGLAMTEKQQ